MKLEQIKAKWQGVQTCWKEGCYFFSLLTIADELDISYDIFGVTRFAIDNGYIEDDGYVNDACGLLYAITGKHFTIKKFTQLPVHIIDNMYTIEKWYNKNTGFTHFKRRFVDTLVSSNTVLNGELVGYYVFIRED